MESTELPKKVKPNHGPSKAVIEEMRRIYKTHGVLSVEIVRPYAVKKDNPLHSQVEWDVKLAARIYQDEQIAELIRSVKCLIVVEEEAAPVTYRVRGFISTGQEDGEYIERTKALKTKVIRASFVQMKLSELQSWVNETADLPELKGLRECIRAEIAKLSN
jgi:hypothetical protein